MKQFANSPVSPLDQKLTDVYNCHLTMKKDLHPTNYRPVVFEDLNNGTRYLTRSTVDAEENVTIDGVEYPLVKVHISSSSHPFFTGEERIVDIEGRVDKFKARREAAQKALDARKKAAGKVRVRKSDDEDEAVDEVATKKPEPATADK